MRSWISSGLSWCSVLGLADSCGKGGEFSESLSSSFSEILVENPANWIWRVFSRYWYEKRAVSIWNIPRVLKGSPFASLYGSGESGRLSREAEISGWWRKRWSIPFLRRIWASSRLFPQPIPVLRQGVPFGVFSEGFVIFLIPEPVLNQRALRWSKSWIFPV